MPQFIWEKGYILMSEKTKKGETKIAWIASSGGHILELSQLKNLWLKYDGFLVTEKGEFEEISMKKTYYIRQMNRRDILSWFTLMTLFARAFSILHKEKVTHIVSTGAMCSFPFIVIGKMMGCKIIYIESFARVDDQSLTGRLVYSISDLFIVQWPELLKKYPKAILGGSIF